MNKQVEKIRAKVEQFYQLREKALKDDCFTGRERADITTECGILRQVLNYIDYSLQSPCSNCTNDKGCINCEDGSMYESVKNLWKPADGDDLPIIDREVIVLYQRYPLEGNEYAVGFGHRPPEYWDGKNIATGEVTRYYPKRYDKAGWNSPNIKWWLDCPLPIKEGGEE